MKVLCVINSLSSGGAERQLVGLATMLQSKGYNVEVCAFKTNNFYADTLNKHKVSYSSLACNNIFRRLLGIIKRIKQIHPDVVISYLEQPSTLCCIAKMFTNFKLIVSERNTTQKLSRNARMRFWLYRFADWIVPNSYTQSRFLETHYPTYRDKIRTITNYTDVNSFIPSSVDAKRDILRFVVAARVTPQKNIPTFTDALSILKKKNMPFIVDWYGNPLSEDYGKFCSQYIKDKGIDDVFRIHPATKNIIAEYQTSDCFILPSIYEGYPNVVCEAMACGLPILCSDVCDNPSIVKGGVNGDLFDPTDPIDICNKMKQFIQSDAKSKKNMGIKSRLIAEQLFSQQEFLEKYVELIKS